MNLQNRLRGGGILAAAGLAAALLVGSIEPSNAGLFSWMKGGQGNTNDGNSGGYNDNSGGSSGNGPGLLAARRRPVRRRAAAAATARLARLPWR